MTRTAENSIALVINNYEPTYREFQRIVGIAWWDDDDNTWNDLDTAAKALRGLVSELDPDEDGFSDLKGIDYSSVDWESIITEELEELNIQEGRGRTAGL